MNNIHVYKTAQEIAEAFSAYLQKYIKDKNAPVYIALSGGSTPKLLYAHIAKAYKDNIDWANVHIFWGDERCVPPDHPESNYKMAHDTLIAHIQIPAQNIHRIIGENNPDLEAIRYSDEIKKIVPLTEGIPTFDIVMLGMGDDGHTLSIFPHEMDLFHSDNVCVVATHPTSGQKRISLSGKVTNHASNVVFIVTGENKAERMREIHKKEGHWATYPASYIKPTRGKLYWYTDQSAAKFI